MNSTPPTTNSALLTVVVLAAIGCSAETNTASVSGNVIAGGKPLAGGVLQFFPAQGRPSIATIDDSGKYELELAPGEYQVTANVSTKLPPGWKEGDPVPPQKVSVPAQFTSRINTPLRTTVTDSGAEPADFVLP